MTTTTYLSTYVLRKLERAQEELNRHLVSGADGRCLTCGEVEPCRRRELVGTVFAKYGRMPRREPGITREAAVKRAARAKFGWFDRGTPAADRVYPLVRVVRPPEGQEPAGGPG
jgi:hypothetical protein